MGAGVLGVQFNEHLCLFEYPSSVETLASRTFPSTKN